MTAQQEFLLGMLIEIDNICKKYNIEYSLAGGTLLGAVRNGGFLPWDDDLDIYMTNSEWKKFEKACRKDIPDNRKLETPLNPDYTNTIPRYTSTDTTAIHMHQALNSSFAGEVIDILVLDPINHGDLEKYTNILMVYSDIANYSGVFGRRFETDVNDYRYYRNLEKEKGTETVRQILQQQLDSLISEDGDIYVMRWGGNPLCWERKWFDETKEILFEGHIFSSCVGIEEYFTAHYGDEWYKVPFVSEQMSHDTASSLRVSPDTAKELCLYKYRDRLKEKLADRKELLLETAAEDHELYMKKLLIEARLRTRDVEERYRKRKFSDTFKPEEISYYEEVFGGFIAWQFSAKIIGRDDWKGIYRYNNPVTADISHEVRHSLLTYLFNNEETYKAFRLLSIYKEPDEYERHIRESILLLRQAKTDIQYGNTNKAKGIISGILEEFPYCKSAIKVLLKIAVEQNDVETCRAYAIKAIADYPEDGDFYYFLSKINNENNLIDFASYNTRNGLVLKDINENKDSEAAEYAGFVLSGKGNSPSKPYHEEIAGAYLKLQSLILRLCSAAGVKAFLNPIDTLNLINGQKNVSTSQTAYALYVFPKEVRKLLKYINEKGLPGNIEIEYMGNNPAFPYSSIRFHKNDTADLDRHRIRNYSNSGIFISIQPLRADEKSAKKLLDLWYKSCSVTKKTVIRLHKAFGEKVYKKVLRKFALGQPAHVFNFNGERITGQKDLFTNYQQISLNGETAYIPSDFIKYASYAQGNFSLNKKHEFFSIEVGLDKQSYKEYKELLQIQTERNEERKWARKIRKDFIKVFNRQKKTMKLADMRKEFDF